MTDDANVFEFADDMSALAGSAAGSSAHVGPPSIRVNLPGRLRNKRKLLEEYARQMSLPDYFGWNWDALEECLRDLSWLEGNPTVLIVHAGVPFHGHSDSRQTYLRVLRDSVRFWNNSPQPGRLRVIFPRETEATVHQAMAAHG